MKPQQVFVACFLVVGVVSGMKPLKKTQSKLSFLSKQSQEAKSHVMKKLYPFYHSTQDIKYELQQLATRCQGMTLQSVEGKSEDGRARLVDVVTVKDPSASPVNKNFVLFGEHSRELISPESGLHLIKSLCGETDLAARAKEVLRDSEFQIVVNGNPKSREKVEQGDFCLRTNPEGVDLNRNWDEEWEAGATLDPKDTNPGPKPFSEPETNAFKELVSQYQPTTFLTIHSGTKGMYMPWAYDMEHLAQRNQPQMMEILKNLDKDHCQCPFGAAGKEVGYSCPGTCLDWVYDKLKTPYAFAFEIYTNADHSEFLKQRWEEKMNTGGAFLQAHSHLGHHHFRDLFQGQPSCFVQTKMQRKGWGDMTGAECFSQFNPESEDVYNEVIENWSAAYLDMASSVAANLKTGTSASSTSGTIAKQSNATKSSLFAADAELSLGSYPDFSEASGSDTSRMASLLRGASA